MISTISAKQIVASVKQDERNLLALNYNMNLYRGCSHNCIYCDTRSECYGIGDLLHIRAKENAIVMLEKELKSKRKKGSIGFGSMHDPYMPVEAREQLTRRALEVIARQRFGVHIITKSDLVVRDIDLLATISKVYATVSVTITCADDALSRLVEPGAPPSSARFEAVQQLSQAGIRAGITLMPILPFINDTEQNVTAIIDRAAKCGAAYILPYMGVTLRDVQRDYFFQKLDTHFPGIRERYIQQFGNSYQALSPSHASLMKVAKERCRHHGIGMQVPPFEQPMNPQLSLF
ncbi:MAG: radical SAM protein [Marinilabiliaceae bacterium]|nr:radical SAM protein [Marinilabiliaceae bacterium]